MGKKQKQTHPERGEDATQYGEFVSSYFTWVTPTEQRKKAEELSKMTEKNKKDSTKGDEKNDV